MSAALKYEPKEPSEWDRIEAEAKEAWRAQLDADHAAPPAIGRPIAWSVSRYKGVTDTITDVHRVGVPNGDAPYTMCGMPIPDPLLWVPISPEMVRAMPFRMAADSYDYMRRCPFCAPEASHFHTEHAE